MPSSSRCLRRLPAELDPGEAWDWVAEEIQDFVARGSLDAKEVVVLLPFVQHVALARAAWARRGDALWMPRFETTQTLAAALAAPTTSSEGALRFDPVADRVQAASLLRRAVPDWAGRDARGFALAVERVMATAQSMARTRAALSPGERESWVARARAALPAAGGLDGRERALARLSLEWSLAGEMPDADALHAFSPAAWVGLRVGARQPLAESLLANSDAPVLWLDAERPMEARSASFIRCEDLEDEARQSAAIVIDHLAHGRGPVALIALDRVLVRRVRALLERRQVPIADETGWKLSTTRAGARIAGLLRAVRPRPASDDVLDVLKSSPLDGPALDALEARWRREHRSLAPTQAEGGTAPATLDLGAELWSRWWRSTEPLRVSRRLALHEWLRRLRAALQSLGLWDALHADAAGVQVLAALRCRDDDAAPAWPAETAGAVLEAAGFRAWVDDVLEQIAFAPPLPLLDGDAPVVVMPLARAMLRPFGAVVCPGADAARLGAARPAHPLLGDALAVTLGLPGIDAQRSAEEQALAQLLRSHRVSLLHRARDGAEPLQPSPWWRRLQYAASRADALAEQAPERLVRREVEPRPVPRPRPTAPQRLPDALDATGAEALRACPYRFFALRLLRLSEADELDDTLDKSDYGSWLHAVLQQFHELRAALPEPRDDAALLAEAAVAQQRRLGREDADFLPYAAWFEGLAPRYLAWLHAEEAGGARLLESELALKAQPAALVDAAVSLGGRLDRVDALGDADRRRLRIVDYKTTGAATLKARVREPLEDTQLPFYAALLGAAQPDAAPGGIEAIYLALDERDGVLAIPHADVQSTAAAMLEGLAHDVARLRAGAAMPALGEGRVCEHCAARGLCRRDHWPADAVGLAGATTA